MEANIMDEKMKNFERIAERRVQEVIKRLQLIGNLSNKNNYSYTEEHVEQIFEALDVEMQSLREKFQPGDHSDNSSFSFRRES